MSEPTVGIEHGLTNYGDADFSLYMRRSFAKSMGYSPEMLARPVVGIAQTASGFNNCHRHFPELLEAVKRGVIMPDACPAGGGVATEATGAGVAGVCCAAMGGVEDGGGEVFAR